MSRTVVKKLPASTREENVRIGPISIFALIVIICLAVLAVLTVSTAHASLVLSQRQAQATHELYLTETAAQTFIAGIDEQLGDMRAPSAASADNDAQSKLRIIDSSLVALRDEAREAVDGQVEITASTINDQVIAEFSCEGGRTLKIAVTILSDGTYRIDKWRMTAVENEEQPLGNLYTGL